MGIVDVHVDPKVQKVIALYADLLARDFYALPIRRQLEVQADRLTEAHHNREDSVCFQIGSWHPDLVGKSDERILNHVFSIDDGRVTIAREHGFTDWHEVVSIGGRESDVAFEKAVDTMLSGDLTSLKAQLREAPGLPGARSQYGHGATLLHYAGANGVESYRQVVPLNLADIVDFLLASGADQNSKADIYGGSTPRELVESSRHSYESKVREDVVGVFSKHAASRNR